MDRPRPELEPLPIKKFLLNRAKKIFFDLKSWGPLKNFKTGSGPYLGLGLSINVKNEMKISLDCPFNLVIP
jgi:hypothetical protein